jgi:hypothetical protein
MMVQSGPVGVHAYWRLREPLLPTAFTTYQKRLIATLDSDPAIHDRARIMRLPGYLNQKPDYPTPCLCEILRHDASRVYDLTEILEHLAELPTAVPVTATATPRPATLLETRGRAALYAARWPGVVQGERNATAFLHVKQLVNDFELDDSAAWEIVSDWNRSNQPPLDDKELGLVFESAKNGASARPRGCKLKEPAPVGTTNSTHPQQGRDTRAAGERRGDPAGRHHHGEAPGYRLAHDGHRRNHGSPAAGYDDGALRPEGG